jgi:hypothetical protein
MDAAVVVVVTALPPKVREDFRDRKAVPATRTTKTTVPAAVKKETAAMAALRMIPTEVPPEDVFLKNCLGRLKELDEQACYRRSLLLQYTQAAVAVAGKGADDAAADYVLAIVLALQPGCWVVMRTGVLVAWPGL